MKIENRPPAEGINATDESPLRELAWLLAGGLSIVVALVFAVSLSAQWLAPRIPYAYEARLAASLPALATIPETEQGRRVQAELQALADRLVAHIDLPEGMTVRVGYREEPVVNAFASVGGQTVFFRGLLEKLESEDALAMVMAHEIAHLKLRHATAALGRGVAVGVLLSIISTELGRNAAGAVLGQAGVLTTLSFNRDQEREADEVALRVIAREYGHVGGAIDLFATMVNLQKQPSALPAVEFLQTHPLTAGRVSAVKAWAADHMIPIDGTRRPLPAALTAVSASTSEK
jgi:beta-barrel assembly-enhancing protease